MDSLRSATRNTGFEAWLDATLRPLAVWPSMQGGSPPPAPDLLATGMAPLARSPPALAEVAEYLAGDGATCKPADACSVGDSHKGSATQHGQQEQAVGAQNHFRPGWEDIFRMNQKQLEVAVRRVSKDKGLDEERRAYLMQNIMASRFASCPPVPPALHCPLPSTLLVKYLAS